MPETSAANMTIPAAPAIQRPGAEQRVGVEVGEEMPAFRFARSCRGSPLTASSVSSCNWRGVLPQATPMCGSRSDGEPDAPERLVAGVFLPDELRRARPHRSERVGWAVSSGCIQWLTSGSKTAMLPVY